MPLEGIKILDLSRVPPGHVCTMMLGDLGAEVLKVEAPPGPSILPPFSGVSPLDDEEGRKTAACYPLNRNKKSIVLNLRDEKAREVLYKLAKDADVLLEGFRPGVMKKLGADYETMAKINPKLVYCSISGYGQDGPYRLLPGHDINYISFGGALGIIGTADSPAIPSNLVGDFAGGSLHAVAGILTAIIARDKTGKGQYVDVSMTDGVVSLLAWITSDYFYQGTVLKRGEGLLSGQEPFYGVYRTKDDKFLSVGCIEPHFWENLCRHLGREDFIPHEMAEAEKKQEILTYFQEVFRTKTRDEWFEELKEKNVAVGKVYDIDEVFTDPQVLHRQMLVKVPHPTLGEVPQVGIALKLSDTPGRIRSTAPVLGEHTGETLQKLGYTEEEIGILRSTGAVS